LGTNFHIVGVAALFARIWGKFEINLVLKWGLYHLLSSSYITHVHFFVIGKVFGERWIGETSRKEQKNFRNDGQDS
jgi:hypothetical protein